MIKYLLYVILVLQFFYTNETHTIPLHLYGRALACMLFFYYMYVKECFLNKNEYIISALLFIPFSCFQLIQAAALQDEGVFRMMLSFFSSVITAFLLIKKLQLNKVFYCLIWFLLINFICSIIWILCGEVRVDYEQLKVYNTFLSLSIPVYVTGDDGWVRLSGFTRNPNILGMIAAYCGVYLDFIKVNKNKKYLCCVLILCIIVITQSRGAILFIGSYYLLKQIFDKKIFKVSILILTLASGLLIMNFMRGEEQDISSGRMEMSQLAWEAYIESPLQTQLFGIGSDTVDEFLWTNTHTFRITIDNGYLVGLLSLGVVGVVINYLSLLCAIFYVYKNSYANKIVLITFFFAMFVYNLVESITFDSIRSIFYEIILFEIINLNRNNLQT